MSEAVQTTDAFVNEVTTLVQALEKTAQSKPDMPSFTDGEESIDFSTLNNTANQLANLLHDCGVGAGDRVGVLMPRCLRTPIAVYGIWKSGAAYVPIDPEMPAREIASLVKDCGLKVLVSHQQLFRTISKLLAEDTQVPAFFIGLSEEHLDNKVTQKNISVSFYSWDVLSEYSIAYQDVSATEDGLAYIIHTSGSTGRPKGIMHSHASALSFARHTVDAHQLTGADILSCHSPLHTDMSMIGLFVAPLLGASTVVIPDSHTRVPASLSLLIQNTGITVWYSVPYALLQLLQNGALEKRNLRSLRWVLYAGEAIAPVKLAEFMQHAPDAQCANLYGPAETNVCTYYAIPTQILDVARSGRKDAISIGQEWGDHQIRIVDAMDEQVAQGETGELLVHSPTMMLGYWRQPELDKRVFLLKDCGNSTKRWYRTGDMVRQNDNGDLHLVGRADRQVKIRGLRLELDAIELSLSAITDVAEVAVFTVPSDSGLTMSAAFIVSDNKLTVEKLRLAASKKLTPASLPEHIQIVSSFPRTTTGKVDRLALSCQLEHQSC